MMTELLTPFCGIAARRFAIVLVALVLGWFGVGEANAQSCDAYADNCTPEQARAACLVVYNDPAWRGSYVPSGVANQDCTVVGNPPSLSGFVSGTVCYNQNQCAGSSRTVRKYFNAACPSGTSWDASSQTCFSCPAGKIKNDITGKCMDKCSSLASPVVYPRGMTPNGSVGCEDGCLFSFHSNGDGSYTGTALGDGAAFHCSVIPHNCEDNGAGWYMNYGLALCVPPTIECNENQASDPYTGECSDSCPAGKVLDANGQCKGEGNTCPAGQVKGPDGSCVQDSCPSGQTKGSDGTCKGSNDPDKDEGDDDKYFSGGDSCNAPPACSGDAIMCGQARIQWRIDCNTRRNVNISGGSCAAIPVCTGEKCNAMEYAQLLQQWRGTCALEKIAKGEGGEGEGNCGQGTSDVNCNGVPDVLEGAIAEAEKGTPGVDEEGNTLWSQVDQGGWLAGGSCPGLPTISIAGVSLTQLSTTVCEQGAVLANLIFLYGLVVAAGIIGRGAAGV